MRRATHIRYITRPRRSFVTRVMSSEIRRLRYVCSGLSQEAYARSCDHWEPDTSAIQMHDFVAESSDETPFERFLVWDPVEDPNVLLARPATAEAIAAALNALPGSGEGEGDATEDERDDGEDGAEEEEANDDGDGNDDDDDNDDDTGGIRVEKK